MERKRYAAVVGKQSWEKVENDNREEDGWRKESSVDLLGDAHEGDARSEGSRWEVQNAHTKGDGDRQDVAKAQLSVHTEDEIAGDKEKSTELQGNARSDGANTEDEGQCQIHGHPLITAAACLLRIPVTLLRINEQGKDDVGFIHLGCNDFVEGEGEINKGHQLQDQIEEGNNSADRTVRNDPCITLDAPYEQPWH